MLDNLRLDNLRIRTKLVAVLTLPVLALLAFAIVGYGQRNKAATRATSDEQIVTAAAATANLIAAMEHEAVASIIAVSDPAAKVDLSALQSATDKAFAAFKQENDKLDLNGNSNAENAASSSLSTLENSTMASFTGFRSQPASDWTTQLENYRNASINGFVDYVQNLAALTSTPEVVLPLQQLGALLNYNLQTNMLSTMANTTKTAGQGAWRGGTDSNQQTVYSEALLQDKANTVLVSLSGTSSPMANYFNQNVEMPANLDQVLTNDWGTALPMTPQAYSTPLDQVAFPSATVTLDDVQKYVTELSGAANDLTQRTTDQIETVRADAVRSARLYVVAGGLVIIIAVVAAIWISRSITRRLLRLTDAADRLSHEQLPRLVDSLKNPAEDDVGYLTSSFAEIDVAGEDEIGQLAGAFNRIQGVAVQVATEQAQLLRKGIGEMFVNLARRNQGLLDRQIEFIDQLESAEEDPDQLENLFRLDHLATRMRRNAESLLVLAGAEPSRRRGKPVPLADVVRAAVGEVEDFARIDMLQFDEVLVASNAALDIAHLLSELMENAANFSPPDTRVEVVGHRTKAEGYVISVTDHGIGMTPEALAESNDLLARPPLVGLALSRSLGFIVIGRLAARFGIAVRLMPSPSSGTTAMVSLPPSLITDQPRTSGGPAALAETANAPVAPPATDDTVALTEGTDRRPAPRRTATTPPPAPPSAPAPPTPQRRPSSEGPATEAVPRRTPLATRTPPVPATEPESPEMAPVSATAEPPAATAGGLTKRVPRSEGAKRAVPGGDGSRSTTQNRRSPDEVRSMLSRYRSGMQQGRTDDENPKTPEADGS